MYFYLQQSWAADGSMLHAWAQTRSSRWSIRKSWWKPGAWCHFTWQVLMNLWSLHSPYILAIQMLGIYLKPDCSLSFHSIERSSTLWKMIFLLLKYMGWSTPLAWFTVGYRRILYITFGYLILKKIQCSHSASFSRSMSANLHKYLKI